MNRLHRKRWFLTAVAVLVFASVSLAQTTSITLTSPGDSSTVGNVYVDPYVGTVAYDGVGSTYVICDDWSDNTYLNETWTANVTAVTSVTSASTTPLFAPTATANGPLTASQLYNELAWLGTQLLTSPTNPTAQAEISFAIWELSYTYAPSTNKDPQSPAAYLSSLVGNTLSPAAYTTLTTGVQSYLTAAASEGSFNALGWEILTPASTPAPTCGGGPCASAPPQEFLIYTPESSATILFSADMFGLLGLAFVFRRRLLRPIL